MLTKLANSGWRFGIIGLPVWVLDQWSKALVVKSIPLYSYLPNWSWFALTHLHNTGASFSFLADAGGWQRTFFLSIALLISLIIAITLARLPSRPAILPLALGLILGGALGNAYDRLLLGYVVDFISVHWQDWFFPAFNIADSAITIGAGLLLIDAWLAPSENSKAVADVSSKEDRS